MAAVNVTRPLLDLRPSEYGVRTDLRVPDGLLVVQQYNDGRPTELTWNPSRGAQVFVELPACRRSAPATSD